MLQQGQHDIDVKDLSAEKDDADEHDKEEKNAGTAVVSIADSVDTENSTKVEGLKAANDDIEHAVMLGTKRWGRSKITIVGEGRAGKTGLANSIMGKTFKETESTVGINDLTLEVKYAYRSSSEQEDTNRDVNWKVYTKPEKELETAIAQMVLDSIKQQKESAFSTEPGVDVGLDNTASNEIETTTNHHGGDDNTDCNNDNAADRILDSERGDQDNTGNILEVNDDELQRVSLLPEVDNELVRVCRTCITMATLCMYVLLDSFLSPFLAK